MPRTPLGRLRLLRALKMPSAFYLAPPSPQSQKCCVVPDIDSLLSSRYCLLAMLFSLTLNMLNGQCYR